MKNTPETSGVIRPIGAANTRAPSRQGRSLSRDIDSLVFVTASVLACFIFGLAAYFFYGFTQTDTGFWTLASAFGLCFGVGSLAYIPLFIIAVIARRSAKSRATRKGFALALLLLLPWVCVSLIFIGFSALPKIYGFGALFLSLSLCFWAFRRLRHLPRT